MLNHPNVIEYYENFLQDKAMVSAKVFQQYTHSVQMIVMEYAAGGTLYDLVCARAKSGTLLEEEEVGEAGYDRITSPPRLPTCLPR